MVGRSVPKKIEVVVDEAMREIEGRVTFDLPAHEAIKEIITKAVIESYQTGLKIVWDSVTAEELVVRDNYRFSHPGFQIGR